MSVSGLGRLAGKAAETVGDFIGTASYPKTEYALAADLFERSAQAERETSDRTRDYFQELMRSSLDAVGRRE